MANMNQHQSQSQQQYTPQAQYGDRIQGDTTVSLNQPTYSLAPEGFHAATIWGYKDRGMETDQFGTKHKCHFTFRLHDMVDEEGKPFTLMQKFTMSGDNRANLVKFREVVDGRALSKEERYSFDVRNYLDKTIMLHIVHNVSEKDGETYANIKQFLPIVTQTQQQQHQQQQQQQAEKAKPEAQIEADSSADDDLPF